MADGSDESAEIRRQSMAVPMLSSNATDSWRMADLDFCPSRQARYSGGLSLSVSRVFGSVFTRGNGGMKCIENLCTGFDECKA